MHFESSLLSILRNCIILLLASGPLFAADFHVATNGDDKNPGTQEKPFATLERARDAVRALKKATPKLERVTNVIVHGGAYELKQPLELTAEDSGTPEAPIVYQAARGEEVRIVGGRTVKDWKPVTDAAVLNRLDPAARGKVMQADLKALGITDFGEMGGGFGLKGSPGIELFFQDQPTTLARYPNTGFMRIAEVLGETSREVRGTKGCVEGRFTTGDKRVERWGNEKDAWVLGYWFWDWAEQRQRIESIDAAKLSLNLRPPFHGYGYRKGQWFYGFNLLCELDSPGEWYLDRETCLLYFWPPAPIDKGRAVVTVLPALVTMKETSHVTFRGFTFEAARGLGIRITGGRSCTIAACTLRNLGQHAIGAYGTGHRVIGCDIYGTGDGGISIGGGDRKSLTAAGIVVENNHIHDYSRWNRMYRSGIAIDGVGQRVRHNLIHSAPHIAISWGGNDQIIEFNEIHSVCRESNDAGAIYCGYNWGMRGNVLQHNYLHDLYGHEGRGCVGIYLDDQFSSARIFGNVFFRVTRAAFIGGGRDSTIENNLFIECSPAIHVDARGLGWAASAQERLTRELKLMPYQSEPWKSRYPELTGLLEDPEPMAPKGNLIARNIQWKGKWDDIERKAYPYLTFQHNMLDIDPKFVDAATHNFQLQDDSPAFKIGFQKIPMEKIGLYQDELRATWPVHHEPTPAPARK